MIILNGLIGKSQLGKNLSWCTILSYHPIPPENTHTVLRNNSTERRDVSLVKGEIKSAKFINNANKSMSL